MDFCSLTLAMATVEYMFDVVLKVIRVACLHEAFPTVAWMSRQQIKVHAKRWYA